MSDYSNVTYDEFNEAVRTIAYRYGIASLLDIPGVIELVSEALNNEALAVCPSAIIDDDE